MARSPKHASKMVGPAAHFHRHDADWEPADEIQNAITSKAPAHNHSARLIQPDETANVLTKIYSKNIYRHSSVLLSLEAEAT